MSDEQPVTAEGAVIDPPAEAIAPTVTVQELEELKKQLVVLQQNYAIMEHTAKVTADNLQRTQQENLTLRSTCVEFQSHIYALCKALGKVMS